MNITAMETTNSPSGMSSIFIQNLKKQNSAMMMNAVSSTRLFSNKTITQEC